MKPKLMVSVLILVVASLALAGLGYQTVPISTTTTIVRQSTETRLSYSPWFFVDTITYTTTFVNYPLYASASWAITRYPNGTVWCIPGYVAQYGAVACALLIGAAMYHETTTMSGQTVLTFQMTDTLTYNQPVTNSFLVPGQSSVPVYSSLGLTDTAFVGLSVLVILLLGFVTARIAVTSKNSHRRK